MLTETNEISEKAKRLADFASESLDRNTLARLGPDQFSPDMQAAFDKIFGKEQRNGD